MMRERPNGMGIFKVPADVYPSSCPECGSRLFIEIYEHETDTGFPTEGGFYVYCERDAQFDPAPPPLGSHAYNFDDWLQIQEELYLWMRPKSRLQCLIDLGSARTRWRVELAIWRHTSFGDYGPHGMDSALVNRPIYPQRCTDCDCDPYL